MTTEITPDLVEAERFLTMLDETAQTFTFQTFDDNADRKDRQLSRILHGSLGEHANQLMDLNRRGAGVYVTVNETDGTGRKKSNIKRVRALWQEADRGDEPTLPLEPQIEVESSVGKHHRYLLVDSMPIKAFNHYQGRLVQDYGSDPNAADIARVLRLPGFYHQKVNSKKGLTGARFMVRITHESGCRPYAFGEIAAALPPVARKPTEKKLNLPNQPLPNAERIRSALASIDPDCPYGEWLSIGMALHSTSDGNESFALWDEWSAKGTLYNPGETEYRWNTFTPDGGYTIRTLFHLAAKSGWDGNEFEVDRIRTFLQDRPSLTPTDIDIVTKMIADAKLTAANKEALLQQLKKQTGVGITTLRKSLDEQASDTTSHPELAAAVVANANGAIYTNGQFYFWNHRRDGVWENVDDREMRKIVADTCQDRLGNKYTKATIDSVIDMVKTDSYVGGHQFNTHTDSINVTNGELVFSDGKWHLEPHVPEHYFTTQLPVAYDPKAKAPRYTQFLDEVFAGDKDRVQKKKLVLEAIGYTMLSTCRFETFFLTIGTGANGKSVLLSVIERLLGREHVAAVQPAQFDSKWQRAHLDGKLANIVTEIAEGAQIADAELKAIVSGELITAEHKNRDPFELRPVATMWFGTNHLPHTRDFSDALFRRARIIRFNNKFEGERRDPHLIDKLERELPGILNLALKAVARVFQQGGFTKCASEQDARREWRLEADQVAQFVAEKTVSDPKAVEPISTLYGRYKNWADDAGIKRTVTKKTFGDRLERLGYKRGRNNQARVIEGINCTSGFDPR